MIVVRLFFSLLILGPVVLGFLHFRKRQTWPAPKRVPHLVAFINSAVLYAIAFNVIFFLQELFLVLGKKALGLTAYLYHNNHTWDGVHEMAPLMQGSGALAIFVFGVIFLAWHHLIRESTSWWKVLVLWLAFHGLIQSVPQVMVAFFAPQTDVGQALVDYWGWSPAWLALAAVVSIMLTAGISAGFSRLFLIVAPPGVAMHNPRARLRFVFYIVMAAAFVGGILVVPFRVPPMSQAIAPLIIFLFTIPWVWAAASRTAGVVPRSNQVNDRILWVPAAMLAVLLLVFRLVLAPGIAF